MAAPGDDTAADPCGVAAVGNGCRGQPAESAEAPEAADAALLALSLVLVRGRGAGAGLFAELALETARRGACAGLLAESARFARGACAGLFAEAALCAPAGESTADAFGESADSGDGSTVGRAAGVAPGSLSPDTVMALPACPGSAASFTPSDAEATPVLTPSTAAAPTTAHVFLRVFILVPFSSGTGLVPSCQEVCSASMRPPGERDETALIWG